MDLKKSEILSEIKKSANEELSNALTSFQNDAPKSIWKSYAFAALAVLILGAVTAIASWSKDNLFEDTKSIAKNEAEKVLKDKIIVSGTTPSSSENAIIINKLNEINKRLDKLENKNER